MFSFDDWGHGRMMDRSYGGGGGMMDDATGWVVMLLGLLLLLAFIGAATYWIVSVSGAPTSTRVDRLPPAPTPRELLDRRLASGEITPEEYGARRELLDR
jgi:uncharacterized membrane protein